MALRFAPALLVLAAALFADAQNLPITLNGTQPLTMTGQRGTAPPTSGGALPVILTGVQPLTMTGQRGVATAQAGGQPLPIVLTGVQTLTMTGQRTGSAPPRFTPLPAPVFRAPAFTPSGPTTGRPVPLPPRP